METEIDLWPDLSSESILTPASMLKIQAEMLSKKTNGRLQGLVETHSFQDKIYHQLFVVVPALENYRYSLLTVHHSPTLYPVTVDESPIEETGPSRSGASVGDAIASRFRQPTALADEKAFQTWLGTALSDRSTKRILQNLLAHATS